MIKFLALVAAIAGALYYFNPSVINYISLSTWGLSEYSTCQDKVAQELDRACHVLEQGNAKRKKKEHQAAIRDFDEAIRLKPDLAFAYLSRGVTYGTMGLLEEAVKDYDQVVRLGDPDLMDDIYTIRGIARSELGLYKESISDYDWAIRQNPGDATTIYYRAYAKQQVGRHKGAIKDYDKAIKLAPGNAIGYHFRGNSKLELGLVEEAVKDYVRALNLDPNNAGIKRSIEKARKLMS